MGHSQAEKQESRKRIVDTASRLFRERGIDRVGLAEVMKESGLTVGAFYRHFDSRDELVAQALADACSEPEACGKSATALEDAMRRYLADSHRDDPGSGCPLATLVNDVARCDDATRQVYTDFVKQTLQRLADLVDEAAPERRVALATLQLSAWIGAISLSRAVSDRALSDQILTSVADQLARGYCGERHA
ncbi:TetR/AcrR family transcriptional regulator [Chitinasiproducens palmae]|uniref:Transcriptional regulator, TetR family n=1 Tax=Chitinasiproducens palmae TaxID=1770053 RepID=A0A1H2PU29_9BURK|nr:TetR/AcrR family transcriptional regulator [Chitinasiproducens palmae]SDV50646.1 transcriptional regulator, TetR family [Chitinasiproducens palmae]